MKSKAAKVPVIAKLPSEDEKKRIVEALSRHLKRASPVTASVAMDAPGAVGIEAPHTDYVGWHMRLERFRAALNRSGGVHVELFG
ncbi:hypothetical protein [Methylobacterium sp. J-068]|uniref:hypothetical protein n=1 Tax=Methylobacterium sp. J-068 TaxID=2836649 RepID=UPI001FB88B4A|nr:hypothetical protein [Methylobacterium sp. J-068]MCJ2032752.1 hypothetical protein [Methylobacterium sp. J-068]